MPKRSRREDHVQPACRIPLLPSVHTSADRHPLAGELPQLPPLPANDLSEAKVSEMLGPPLLLRVMRDLGGMGARRVKRS